MLQPPERARSLIKVDVFRYLDYRKFLIDFYAANKESHPFFSHRYFAQKAGLRSYNYLNLVMAGKRHLTSTFMPGFCRALGLSVSEGEYLKKLVELSRRADDLKRGEILADVLKRRPYSPVYIQQAARLNFCRYWYYPPILELSFTYNFEMDPAWISQRLGITMSQARRALNELTESGHLIEVQGRWKKAEELTDSTYDIPSFLIRSYHRQNLQRASDSIDRLDVNERDLSTITFAANLERFEQVKARIKEFRREIFELIAHSPKDADEVYQFSCQFFRITSPSISEAKLQGDDS